MRIRDIQYTIVSHVHNRYKYKVDECGDLMYSHGNAPMVESIRNTGIISLPDTHYSHAYINMMELPDTLPNDVLDGYYDVLSIDTMMIGLSNGYSVSPLGMYLGSTYQGSVWVITSSLFPNHIGLYGIRSSIILNLQGKRGIARMLIEYVKSMYKGYTIVVPSPLLPMIGLLTSCGFIRYEDINTMEYLFISSISRIVEYYVLV